MRPPSKSFNVNAVARKIDVDNRIPLRNYYRIADNLLRQASIYRGEKNIIDLYIILLRYSSLVSETIPFHRDYQVSYPKERSNYRKKLLAVIDELESLKPEFQRQVDESSKVHAGTQQYQFDGPDKTPYVSEASSLEWPPVNNKASSSFQNKQSQSGIPTPLSSWKQGSQALLSTSIDMQLQKLSVSLPLPKKETLSRHSFLGPTGLRGQWLGPTAETKVHYPTYTDLTSNENSSQNQTGLYDHAALKDGDSTANGPTVMASVLSLDDGRWLSPAENLGPPLNNEARNDHFPLGIIRQPSPPPVLAQVQPECIPIPPSRVADPRPGPVKQFQDGTSSSNSYQHLHIPIKMMEDFLRLAQENTARNLETCGVLAGSLKNKVFHITTLIIPKQESTSDSCQTLNEEEIFEVQDKFSLFPLGWIHTHPSQTCFMSSVDLHTHYSYQAFGRACTHSVLWTKRSCLDSCYSDTDLFVERMHSELLNLPPSLDVFLSIMLPEAIAIVMAPKDTSSPHGIFHLSDPSGVTAIRNCQQRGFHPHEEPEDGSPIYEHCSHVFMNHNLQCHVVDLR